MKTLLTVFLAPAALALPAGPSPESTVAAASADISVPTALQHSAAIDPSSTANTPSDLKGWFIRDMTRRCMSNDHSCTYSFGIESFIHPLVQCIYKVTGQSAATSSVSNIRCEPFFISSGWSGQFGDGQGFTTWSITDHRYIAWPAYSDRDLANGVVVQPDRNYTVYNLD
ncbi:hypothetical protein TD95_000721 [Thielaviopsis punctulata]|uniref:Uncharacterized protein n=1 Tax=Thielaviopsis punctulata TaxID=72032 RepID=A0A0F4ZKW9_9PEZI|nr:hypothetical protein TD95_000721 [Thielaviopsis punctulata]